MLRHERYHGVWLTPNGKQLALQVIRRCRLIGLYLNKALGYEWHEIEAEVEHLEYAVSERLTEQIAVVLGHPEIDLFGNPIPSAEGKLVEQDEICLTNLVTGAIGYLTRITNPTPNLLCYLAEKGLYPGVELCVLNRSGIDGTLTIQMVEFGEQLILHYDIARHLLLTYLLNRNLESIQNGRSLRTPPC